MSERRYRCTGCGFESDRDLNAALNLFRTVSSTGCQAPVERKALANTGVKPSSWKQEPGRDQT
ncbi:MAG TPA: zinc ribbon domain-containing protein [Vicinamibacteria bacterium]